MIPAVLAILIMMFGSMADESSAPAGRGYRYSKREEEQVSLMALLVKAIGLVALWPGFISHTLGLLTNYARFLHCKEVSVSTHTRHQHEYIWLALGNAEDAVQ